MADRCSLKVKVHEAWWLRPYLHAWAFFCAIMDCEPDAEKLDAVIRRAVTIEVV